MATALTEAGFVGHDALFVRAYATGAAAIDHTLTVPAGKVLLLRRLTLHMSAAPVASENFVVKIDSDLGAAYDTTLYSLNLSTGSTTDVLLTSEEFGELEFVAGEVVTITFANTNTNTWGLTALFEER
jgi:hypothetical protein